MSLLVCANLEKVHKISTFIYCISFLMASEHLSPMSNAKKEIGYSPIGLVNSQCFQACQITSMGYDQGSPFALNC
jgi:hypothetical protein